jgi:hypothetical protein
MITLDENDVITGEETSKEKRSFDIFLTPNDLLQTVDPDPVYLIGGDLLTLEKGNLVLIDAPPGGKKSLTAMDIAVCVASGHSWLGQPTTKAKVLYIDFENGRRRGKKRLTDAMAGYSIKSDIPLATCFNMKIDLMLPESIGDVMYAIEYTQAELVVIDTLTRTHRGKENESGDMKIVMEQWSGLTRQFGCCILIIHHAGKGGEYRGSTEIQGVPDVHYQLDSQQGSNIVKVKAKKLRDGTMGDFEYEYVFGQDSTRTQLKEKQEKATAEKEPYKIERCMTMILRQLSTTDKLVPSGELIRMATQDDFNRQLGIKALNRLVEEGQITKTHGKGNSVFYSLPSE